MDILKEFSIQLQEKPQSSVQGETWWSIEPKIHEVMQSLHTLIFNLWLEDFFANNLHALFLLMTKLGLTVYNCFLELMLKVIEFR